MFSSWCHSYHKIDSTPWIISWNKLGTKVLTWSRMNGFISHWSMNHPSLLLLLLFWCWYHIQWVLGILIYCLLQHFEWPIASFEIWELIDSCSHNHQVVENAANSSQPNGAHSTSQNIENVKNFLVAVEDMGLPSFEIHDLEQVRNNESGSQCIRSKVSENKRKGVRRICSNSSFELLKLL